MLFRSVSRYHLHQQILELWPVIDDLTNEPTFRVNLQIEVSHLLEYRADQVIAVATAAQRHEWDVNIPYWACSQ